MMTLQGRRYLEVHASSRGLHGQVSGGEVQLPVRPEELLGTPRSRQGKLVRVRFLPDRRGRWGSTVVKVRVLTPENHLLNGSSATNQSHRECDQTFI